MKTKIIYLALFMSITACTTTFKRTGYKAAPDNYVLEKTCKYAIKYQAQIPGEKKVLGTVEASDTIFSTQCQESYAMYYLIRDACSVNANLINIVEEAQPTMWNSCYRAKAELVYVDDPSLQSDDRYSQEKMSQRSAQGDKQSSMMFVGAFMGGIGGMLVGGALTSSPDSAKTETKSNTTGRSPASLVSQ